MRKREALECAAVPEEKKEAAAQFLRDTFTINEKEWLVKMMGIGLDRWWFAKHHLGAGMVIRNLLRTNGFGEKELGISNLDFIYCQLLERAVLGHERNYDAVLSV
jgi:hypothetical protein